MGGAAGAIASGYCWAHYGPAITFTLAAGCAFAGMVLLWLKLHLPPAGETVENLVPRLGSMR